MSRRVIKPDCLWRYRRNDHDGFTLDIVPREATCMGSDPVFAQRNKGLLAPT